jgi:hypothetical protein
LREENNVKSDQAGILAIVKQHAVAELSVDIDGTMATLVDHPVYNWFPNRLRIEGADAVREMYARLAPLLIQFRASEENRSTNFTTFAESAYAVEVDLDYRIADGSIKRVHTASFIRFDGGRLLGETTYLDSYLADVVNSLLGDEFRKLPGVTVI